MSSRCATGSFFAWLAIRSLVLLPDAFVEALQILAQSSQLHAKALAQTVPDILELAGDSAAHP